MDNKEINGHTDGSFLGYNDEERVILVTLSSQELNSIINIYGNRKSIAGIIHEIIKEDIEHRMGLIGEDDEDYE